MTQKRTSSKKAPAAKAGKSTTALRSAGRAARRTIKALPLTWISLGLNAVLLIVFFTLIGWTHIHSFWFAERLQSLHANVCPKDVAQSVSQTTQNNTTVVTYTVTQQAIKSGCAQALAQNARLSDYMTHPEHASQDAQKLLPVSDKGLPTVTVLKSAETGEQLLPTIYNQ